MLPAGQDYKATKFDLMVAYSMIIVGLCGAVFGIGVLGFQFILWLRDGAWTSFELRFAWDAIGGRPPNFSWRGVQKIVTGVLELPLSFSFFVPGWMLIGSGIHAVDVTQASLRAQKLKWW